MVMAAATAFRPVLRSSTLRNVSARIAANNFGARSTLRHPKINPAATRFIRYSATCFCLDSLLPMHTATASALMTSLLSVSMQHHGSFSEGCCNDV